MLITFLLSATNSVHFLVAFFEWIGPSTVVVFILSTLFLSYVLGRKVGTGMLRRGKNGWWVGYSIAITVVLISTLLASLFTLRSQFLSNGLPGDWWFYYLAKPIIWMISLSILPILIAGTWYKNQLEKQVSKLVK